MNYVTEKDDGYRNSYGFGRVQNNGEGVYWQFGPDKKEDSDSHAFACDFVMFEGVLPCNCDDTRKRKSEWWHYWLRWSRAYHRASSNTEFPIPWPINGADGSPWIKGIDFD